MNGFGLPAFISNYIYGPAPVENRELVIVSQDPANPRDPVVEDIHVLDSQESQSASEFEDSASESDVATSTRTDIPVSVNDDDSTNPRMQILQQLDKDRQILEENKRLNQDKLDNLKKTADLMAEVSDLSSKVTSLKAKKDTLESEKLSTLMKVKDLNDKATEKETALLELHDITVNIKNILVEVRTHYHTLKYQHYIQSMQVESALNPSLMDRFIYIWSPESVVNKKIRYDHKEHLSKSTLSQQEVEDRIANLNVLIAKKNVLKKSIKDSCQIAPTKLVTA
jgi:hypothetical protein